MTVFWFSTAVLIVASAILIGLPLFKTKRFDDAERRDELNKALFKDRLTELEEEASEGIATDSQELVADLKQSLLDDIPQDQAEVRQAETDYKPLHVFVPSILLLAAISYGMYSSFGNLDKVTDWQDTLSELPKLTQKLMSPSDERPLTDEEMDALTLGLRTQLHKSPEDANGWLLLGRIALANQDGGTAEGAFGKAYKLDPENPDIRLGYAQSKMMSQDEQERAMARSMLIGLLQDSYVDLRIYSLLAFDSYQNNQFEAAIRYWRMMQKMIGPEDSRYSMLERSIQNAENQLGKSVSTTSVPVMIKLGEGIQPGSQGVLIVSVHDGAGSPIPVAAARYPVGSFPRTVVLDDGNVMMEGQSISSLESIIVRARIDTDGNVASKGGDWFGESVVTKLGEQVEITIDKQY
ncbi:c-type cytochrome biogenesis protein CcmI [Vibrio hannami]|uniref:c-type cytochrome biogenesis protein CcmI n=1 Tax=Vibrio hannami TaxID=2717094 RepID=UPI00240F6DB7|nr:c-type cytochrome biogenesis protein CcmI [Vibrio hannami]MDG3088743.1 c-type cytochrome biogenesis protein CcmI [Vibrio hannami]